MQNNGRNQEIMMFMNDWIDRNLDDLYGLNNE